MTLDGVFGSIMVGSASRFKTGSQPDANQGQATFERAVTSPEHFSGLRTGPEVAIEYEQALALPVEGSNPLLRGLSPFMLQVEPPSVYQDFGDPGFQKKDPGVLLDRAQSSVNPFASARAALQASALGMDRAGSQRSVEHYISSNAVRHESHGGDGKVPTGTGGRASARIGTPSIADMKTAVDIANQIRAAVNTPPLILLINPSTLGMTFTKVQQFQDRTRSGFVFHAWGEEQPILAIEAQCGAFYSAGRGVQAASRRESASWNNMMSLFHLYKNNGYIYDTVGASNAHHLVGTLSIHYDGWIYYGHLSSFSWSYEEQKPHGGVSVTMEFTVSWMVDTTKMTTAVMPLRAPTMSPSDPRYTRQRNLNAPAYPVGVDSSPGQGGQQQPWSVTPGVVERFPGTVPVFKGTVAAGTGNFRGASVQAQVPVLSQGRTEPFRG
jgi:hypothetical protein